MRNLPSADKKCFLKVFSEWKFINTRPPLLIFFFSVVGFSSRFCQDYGLAKLVGPGFSGFFFRFYGLTSGFLPSGLDFSVSAFLIRARRISSKNLINALCDSVEFSDRIYRTQIQIPFGLGNLYFHNA